MQGVVVEQHLEFFLGFDALCDLLFHDGSTDMNHALLEIDSGQRRLLMVSHDRGRSSSAGSRALSR